MTRYWFISTKYRQSSKLALVTFGLAFVVIMLGAYTRLTNAGLSCPDWPQCYGYITAPHTSNQISQASQLFPETPINVKKAWTEMTHRYFAGFEGCLILLLAGTFLFSRKAKDHKAIVTALVLIGLLVVQVMLGMLTVTEKLKPIIVLGHLLTGISIISVVWWTYLDLHLRHDLFVSRASLKFKPWLWLAFGITVLQITLGGWVSTHYAGLACVDFPYCNGTLMPDLKWNQLGSDLITIHMLHRIGALITAVYTVALAFFLWRNNAFRSIATLLFALIALQITLGILNIIWLRPVWLAVIHQSVAIVILLTLITAIAKASIMTDKRHDSWMA